MRDAYMYNLSPQKTNKRNTHKKMHNNNNKTKQEN